MASLQTASRHTGGHGSKRKRSLQKRESVANSALQAVLRLVGLGDAKSKSDLGIDKWLEPNDDGTPFLDGPDGQRLWRPDWYAKESEATSEPFEDPSFYFDTMDPSDPSTIPTPLTPLEQIRLAKQNEGLGILLQSLSEAVKNAVSAEAQDVFKPNPKMLWDELYTLYSQTIGNRISQLYSTLWWTRVPLGANPLPFLGDGDLHERANVVKRVEKRLDSVKKFYQDHYDDSPLGRCREGVALKPAFVTSDLTFNTLFFIKRNEGLHGLSEEEFDAYRDLCSGTQQ
ncbi:hypothetical protein L202_02478 [Cryptococcus amylolentus CBS 6039]|uniref:Uncharacterized protein n=2 Tax=Cryptococcus amylolentus TaxID=104669 RepID=A0A1E3I104_9TREE|nr:hypothetical protein L202_02478 [Cryptococcus amylolentus CBS 6039]ODN82188.1 hypothetical protein L202_02478 [Cryptococcus amylolentus CBS 6039]ODO09723.1 hypothetical protein I350_01939 [Cryptococcus amylolentus CBS 6273]